MKKVINNILVFLIAIIIIDLILGSYFSSLYEKNYCQHAGGDLNYYLKYGQSDTIIVGSSRVNTMIDNKKINPNAVNISKPSKHLYYNCAVIHLLKQYDKLPENLIILNLEPEDFYIENENDLLEDVYYLKYYYNSNKYINEKINEISIYEPLKFLSKSYPFNGENFKLFTNQFQNICDDNINGFYPLNYSISKSKYLQEKNKISKKISNKINQNIFQELYLIHKICKAKRIKLCLLLGPTIKKSNDLKQLIVRKINTFSKKLKIEIFNFSNTNYFNDYTLWADPFHLNYNGSKIYTNLIIEKIKFLKKTDN